MSSDNIELLRRWCVILSNDVHKKMISREIRLKKINYHHGIWTENVSMPIIYDHGEYNMTLLDWWKACWKKIPNLNWRDTPGLCQVISMDSSKPHGLGLICLNSATVGALVYEFARHEQHDPGQPREHKVVPMCSGHAAAKNCKYFLKFKAQPCVCPCVSKNPLPAKVWRWGDVKTALPSLLISKPFRSNKSSSQSLLLPPPSPLSTPLQPSRNNSISKPQLPTPNLRSTDSTLAPSLPALLDTPPTPTRLPSLPPPPPSSTTLPSP